MTADSPGWLRVVAEVPAALEDDAAAALGTIGLGVAVAPAGMDRRRLEAYFSVSEAADRARGALERALAAHGADVGSCGVRIEPVPDERWAEAFQRSLRPFPLGERFAVVPGDDGPVPEGRRVLRLSPGMAFGTGEHPTTQLCAAILEGRVAPGSRWLDLGCGTGVLSLVAALCGASRVAAVDVDPEAAGVARTVVRENGLADAVDVRCGSVEDATGPFDGIVANIACSFFLVRAPAIAAALAQGGVLIASGFLEDDRADVEEALASVGLRATERRADAPWAAVVAVREDR